MPTPHQTPPPPGLLAVLERLGFHDGSERSLTADGLRIQCPECNQFVTIADAHIAIRDGATIYECPADREELASVLGERALDFYGATEIQRGHESGWLPWTLHQAKARPDR